MDLGVDSLDAVKLVQDLNGALSPSLTLRKTVIFDHPSIHELAAFLHAELEGEPGPQQGLAATGDALAIVSELGAGRGSVVLAGAQGRWPGADASPLRILSAGGDAVSRVPSQRWQPTPNSPSAALHGGFVVGAQAFDNAAFGISAAEAAAMDPQQRLLLELGYASLHATGQRRANLREVELGVDFGVFLGIMNTDFASLLASSPAASESVYEATGGTISIAAGRISFCLGTQGPCVSYDTACSSALVALHAASAAFRSGECNAALALGVSLMLAPRSHELYARAGMLSSDGRCKSFDARANGHAERAPRL
jgi:acyl transferase domain-containing protein